MWFFLAARHRMVSCDSGPDTVTSAWNVQYSLQAARRRFVMPSGGVF
jgi:hypothetical protein